MEVKSGFSSAVEGIQRGMQGLARNADEIAKATNGEGGDIVRPLIESHMNKMQVEASSKVLKTLDETVGSLLDELA